MRDEKKKAGLIMKSVIFLTLLLASLAAFTPSSLYTKMLHLTYWVSGVAWQPSTSLSSPVTLRKLEQQTLNIPMTEREVLPLDRRDAVREVVLAHSTLSHDRAIKIADTVYAEAMSLGYDPFLVLAMIQVESRFDADAKSSQGAQGLMQITQQTQNWLLSHDSLQWVHELSGDENVQNVQLGVRYFASLQQSFRRVDRALQAYNCGPSRLRLVMNDVLPMPEETKYYAVKVLRHYRSFLREYSYLKQ